MEQTEKYLLGGGILVAILLLVLLFASPQIEEVDYSYRDKPIDNQPIQPVSPTTTDGEGTNIPVAVGVIDTIANTVPIIGVMLGLVTILTIPIFMFGRGGLY